MLFGQFQYKINRQQERTTPSCSTTNHYGPKRYDTCHERMTRNGHLLVCPSPKKQIDSQNTSILFAQTLKTRTWLGAMYKL